MLLHVTKWDAWKSRYMFLNREGSQTTNRDDAEVWTDLVEAEAAAKDFGGCVVDASTTHWQEGSQADENNE